LRLQSTRQGKYNILRNDARPNACLRHDAVIANELVNPPYTNITAEDLMSLPAADSPSASPRPPPHERFAFVSSPLAQQVPHIGSDFH
jgi:hypothetical protein